MRALELPRKLTEFISITKTWQHHLPWHSLSVQTSSFHIISQILDQFFFLNLPSGIGLQLSIIPSIPWVALNQIWAVLYQAFTNIFWNHLCLQLSSSCNSPQWTLYRSTQRSAVLLNYPALPSSSDVLFPALFLPLSSSLPLCPHSYSTVRFMQLTPVSCFLCTGCFSPTSVVWSGVSCPLTSWMQPRRSY